MICTRSSSKPYTTYSKRATSRTCCSRRSWALLARRLKRRRLSWMKCSQHPTLTHQPWVWSPESSKSARQLISEWKNQFACYQLNTLILLGRARLEEQCYQRFAIRTGPSMQGSQRPAANIRSQAQPIRRAGRRNGLQALGEHTGRQRLHSAWQRTFGPSLSANIGRRPMTLTFCRLFGQLAFFSEMKIKTNKKWI